MASKYPVQSRLEQNRTHPSTTVTLDNDGYQIVTRKRKALEELAEVSFNTSAAKIKPGKQNKPLSAITLAEKELGQQKMQFSFPVTKFTRTFKDSADTSMDAALFSLL